MADETNFSDMKGLAKWRIFDGAPLRSAYATY